MKAVTMRGHLFDMSVLMAKNSQKVALGNASMNARGDIVSESGHVIKPREEIAREYHKNRPKVTRQVALRDIPEEQYISAEEAAASMQQRTDEGPSAERKSKKRLTDD